MIPLLRHRVTSALLVTMLVALLGGELCAGGTARCPVQASMGWCCCLGSAAQIPDAARPEIGNGEREAQPLVARIEPPRPSQVATTLALHSARTTALPPQALTLALRI